MSHVSEHVGSEVTDDLGRTYDSLGSAAASQFWNERKFFGSIMNHVQKSNDFTVIDVTGFASEHRSAVEVFLNGLLDDLESKVVRIGF
jgi:hypothetical protein